ncbi:hypothetical protein KTH81_18060 [Lachnospiraceae bacterium ASD3451]|uniref:hypothetical protein n=1 Tax=Diplocloster agilis TaxID=2850323 RepID=UPI001DB26222|nr:hypothetical protein [Diplocloster agilis]MBU9745732.1 hypothetical protein [Diplocloster agilis]
MYEKVKSFKSDIANSDPAILKEYKYLKIELKDIQQRITGTEKSIHNLSNIHNYENNSELGILKERKNLYHQEVEYLEKLTNSVLLYIETLPTSELRTLFRLYYLDNLTWIQVSFRMNSYFPGKIYTEDSCRMKHNRFFKKQNARSVVFG